MGYVINSLNGMKIDKQYKIYCCSSYHEIQNAEGFCMFRSKNLHDCVEWLAVRNMLVAENEKGKKKKTAKV